MYEALNEFIPGKVTRQGFLKNKQTCILFILLTFSQMMCIFVVASERQIEIGFTL